jgi:hypothetical protein
VQTVRPGIVPRFHVFPPSSEEATRSVRVELGPTSCFQAAMMICASPG